MFSRHCSVPQHVKKVASLPFLKQADSDLMKRIRQAAQFFTIPKITYTSFQTPTSFLYDTCQTELDADVPATEKDSAATECVDIDTNPNDECLSTSPTPPTDTGAIKATVTPPVKARASELTAYSAPATSKCHELEAPAGDNGRQASFFTQKCHKKQIGKSLNVATLHT